MSERAAVTSVRLAVRDYDMTYEMSILSTHQRRYRLEVSMGDAMTAVAAQLRQLAEDIDPQPVATKNEWRD